MTLDDARTRLPRNRSIPDVTVIPVLNYPDVGAAVEWLCRCFGFVERLRIAEHRAQLIYGDGAIVAADQGPSEPSALTLAHSIMVRVADVDSHFARAQAGGALIVRPPADHPYGERQYTAQDPGGHVWTFTQSVADVDPSDWGGIVGPGMKDRGR